MADQAVTEILPPKPITLGKKPAKKEAPKPKARKVHKHVQAKKPEKMPEAKEANSKL